MSVICWALPRLFYVAFSLSHCIPYTCRAVYFLLPIKKADYAFTQSAFIAVICSLHQFDHYHFGSVTAARA